MSAENRLSLVVYQEVPGLWVGRGIEHDLTAEGRSIAETVRAVLRMVQAHAAFDARHDRPPLSAFRPAPQACWNAFHAGTQIPLAAPGLAVLSEKGHVFVAQASLTIQLGSSGIKIPLGISWANRTDLVVGNQVRGHVGVTIDTSSLALLSGGGR